MSIYERIDLAPNADLIRKYVWNTYGRVSDCHAARVVQSGKIGQTEKPGVVGRNDKIKGKEYRKSRKFSLIY